MQKKLAELHKSTMVNAKGLDIINALDWDKSIINASEMLDGPLKAFVLQILGELPQDAVLCHGDFHPGNIIVNKDRYCIIDWFGSYAGRALSDVAHSYLLMRNVPRLLGQSALSHFFVRRYAMLLSRSYLYACYSLMPFDWAEFSKWIIIKAAKRLTYGMQSERKVLLRYIRNCCQKQHKGEDAALWWRSL